MPVPHTDTYVTLFDLSGKASGMRLLIAIKRRAIQHSLDRWPGSRRRPKARREEVVLARIRLGHTNEKVSLSVRDVPAHVTVSTLLMYEVVFSPMLEA